MTVPPPLPNENPNAPGEPGLDPAALLAAGIGSQPHHGSLRETAPVSPWQDVPSPDSLAPEFPGLEILNIIGRGGMGVVYRARQKALDRVVALKIVHGRASSLPQFSERFQREARAMARLNHPSIVTLHEFGTTPGGRHYFLMEYVEGANLRTLLQAGRMEPAQALTIVPRICDALQYAHDEGIVHRDIKPENILIDRKGRVKIADFGLAKLLQPSAPAMGLTDSHMAMGTPHYMAPEQIERPLDVDHRADVYALGVVFYEMLTGELPLGRFASPSEKTAVDARIDDVVMKALTRDRELRTQHASDVRSGIEAAASGPVLPAMQSPARPATPAPAPYKKPGKWCWAALLAAPVQIVTILGLLGAFLFTRALPPNPASDPAAGTAGGSIGWGGLLLVTFVPTLVGITLGIRGLGAIRRASGELRGAAAAAAGILFFPVLIVWVIFSFLIRFVHAVMAAWDSQHTFGEALSWPRYGQADDAFAAHVALAFLLSNGIGVIGVLLLRHWAMPWRSRASQPATATGGYTPYRTIDPETARGAKSTGGGKPFWQDSLVVTRILVFASLFVVALTLNGLASDDLFALLMYAIMFYHSLGNAMGWFPSAEISGWRSRLIARFDPFMPVNVFSMLYFFFIYTYFALSNDAGWALLMLVMPAIGSLLLFVKDEKALLQFFEGSRGKVFLILTTTLVPPVLLLITLWFVISPSQPTPPSQHEEPQEIPAELSADERAEVDRLVSEQRAEIPPAPALPPRHALRVLLTAPDGRQTSASLDPARLAWFEGVPGLVFRGATGPRPDDLAIEIRLRTSTRGFDEYWIKTTRQHPEESGHSVSTIMPDASFSGLRKTVFHDAFAKLEFLPINEPR